MTCRLLRIHRLPILIGGHEHRLLPLLRTLRHHHLSSATWARKAAALLTGGPVHGGRRNWAGIDGELAIIRHAHLLWHEATGRVLRHHHRGEMTTLHWAHTGPIRELSGSHRRRLHWILHMLLVCHVCVTWHRGPISNVRLLHARRWRWKVRGI
jgi:hypothetical protein